MDEMPEIRDERAKRPLPLKRIVIAFILATLIFLLGFLISYWVSYSKYQSLAISAEQIRYDLTSLELEKELIANSCNINDIQKYSIQLDESGSMLSSLEERLGKDNSNVLNQKKTYSITEVQHFLLIKDFNARCKSNFNTILFFYSNEKEQLDRAEKIGYILMTLKKNNPKTMIYSFDYNLDSSLIGTLKNKYNITQENTVLINEKNKIMNLTNINEISKYIK